MRSALALLGGCVTSLHVTAPATVTTTAPAFALAAQDGRTYTLANGPVVLVFYRGFW